MSPRAQTVYTVRPNDSMEEARQMMLRVNKKSTPVVDAEVEVVWAEAESDDDGCEDEGGSLDPAVLLVATKPLQQM